MRWWSRMLQLTVAFALAVSAIVAGGHRDVLASNTIDMAMSLPFNAACLDCSYCNANGEDGNKAPEGDDTSVHDRGSGPHSNCYGTGGCVEQHPIVSECFEQSKELLLVLEEVRQAIIAGNRTIAKDLALRQPKLVAYVAERDAIQAFGCKGQIIAHLPLSSRMTE